MTDPVDGTDTATTPEVRVALRAQAARDAAGRPWERLDLLAETAGVRA